MSTDKKVTDLDAATTPLDGSEIFYAVQGGLDTQLTAQDIADFAAVSAGSGTVTSVSVTTANGVSGSVATATTTPAITLTLGAITPSSVTLSSETASTLASFDGSKLIKSLATATYPSLTEISYVKGVTSAIQTQIDGKQATLVSGTNIKSINGASILSSGDLTLATGSGSASGTNTGDQSLFKTISVSGQSDVVADSATDTLTLVAGSNVTITTDATTDTITIAAAGGSGSPGGSDTQVQFNDSGSFAGDAGLTYNKTTDALTVTGLVNTPIIQAHTSGGLTLEAQGGGDVLIIGSGGGVNATAYGGWNFDGATADTIASFGASKTLTSLSTATYPSLTELSYVKGVSSAIQTQITGKLGTSLTSAQFFVGNGSNVATGVAMSGDATLANTGAVTVNSASDTVAGKVELAITSEVNTGTDATRAVTPDSLAGSYAGTKAVSLYVVETTTVLTTGDGKAYFRIPESLNGMNLVTAAASVFGTSSSGTPTIQIARGRQANATSAHSFVDMLTTAITIDVSDYDSKDATTPPSINTSNDDVLTGDLIRVDVDTAGTGTDGLFVNLEFRLP